MKKCIIVFLVCFLVLNGFAQKPQFIQGFAHELKSLDWYKEQKKLWKLELEKNMQDANAWYCYYRVSRNLSRLDTADKRDKVTRYNELKTIVNDMEKHVPNSYEFNVCKFMETNAKEENEKYILKAIELGKGKTTHLADAIIWAEEKRDINKRNYFANEWYKSNDFSPGLLYYGYNVLMSAEKNGIILTFGDNDTYPLYLLQSQGLNAEAMVINTSMLGIDSYRKKIFSELGIADYSVDNKTKENSDSFAKYLVEKLAKNKANRKLYISISCGHEYAKTLGENLYLTGLTYLYSQDAIDNTAIIKRNFEKVFALDYLTHPFFYDISAYYTNQMNQNYIVPLLNLYKHYALAEEKDKQEKTKSLILLLVKGTNLEPTVLPIIK